MFCGLYIINCNTMYVVYQYTHCASLRVIITRILCITVCNSVYAMCNSFCTFLEAKDSTVRLYNIAASSLT